jgi:hypothetical protein
MQRRAKVFMNNRSQAVRLPKEFQFSTDEVFIRKDPSDLLRAASVTLARQSRCPPCRCGVLRG